MKFESLERIEASVRRSVDADVESREPDQGGSARTLPYVPGRRYLGKPVYVATSKRTRSGGEEFAYVLQQVGRAVVVGERTAGAAHLTQVHRIDEHFAVHVPIARPVSPLTGTNWEGTGVTPDIEALAHDAVRVAHAEALEHVLATLAGAERAEAESALTARTDALTKLSAPSPLRG